MAITSCRQNCAHCVYCVGDFDVVVEPVAIGLEAKADDRVAEGLPRRGSSRVVSRIGWNFPAAPSARQFGSLATEDGNISRLMMSVRPLPALAQLAQLSS